MSEALTVRQSVDWREHYQARLVSPEDVIARISSGARIRGVAGDECPMLFPVLMCRGTVMERLIIPALDVAKTLGESAIRFFGLDRESMQSAARKIGPTVEQVIGKSDPIDPQLIEHLQFRGGYLKPAEEIDYGKIDALLDADLGAEANDETAIARPGRA